MDGVLAINELNDLTKRLGVQIKQLGEYGRKYAKAEHDYNIAVAEFTVRERENGTPATLIDKIVKGKVAKERLELTTADVMYKTALEEVNGTKLKIRVLDSQIQREWGLNQ